MNCQGPFTRLTSAVPTVMRAIDARMTRRGPNRSTSAPKAGWPAAFTRRLAVAASASVERSTPSSPRIGLKRIPKAKLTPGPDEQDGESGGERSQPPRAGHAHRAVMTRQVPTA